MRGSIRSTLNDPVVAIYRSRSISYPLNAPYHPPEPYPELARLGVRTSLDSSNHVYASVRECLRLLDFDGNHFGRENWNPLGGLVRPGDRVLIKPNWVSHEPWGGSWEQIVTHGSVIRPLIDYVQLALQGRGVITLADGPMLMSDFDEICRMTGVYGLRDHYAQFPQLVQLNLVDLRTMRFETKDAVVVRRHGLAGDPAGGTRVDLGRHSALYGFEGEGRYYGADYDVREVNRHHSGDTHEYQLSRTAMGADVVIDVPKLKSHHKAGVTLAMKGIVGLNCGRNWLPHRTQGTPADGGDQFQSSGIRQQAEAFLVPTLERASLAYPAVVSPLFRVAKRIGRHIFGETRSTIRGGGWYGNDTMWRMIHDINRALMYADRDGALKLEMTKRRFCIVDGIIAGQGMGPTMADPVACGVVLAGQNPIAVDVAGTELIGFDSTKIPVLANAFSAHAFPFAAFDWTQILIRSNVEGWQADLEAIRCAHPFAFTAPLGWAGTMERQREAAYVTGPV